MELPVVESKRLDDGLHTGVIVDVEYRNQPYSYTDIVIELADKFKVKCGYPTVVNEASGLGQLLKRFGAGLKVGESLDPSTILPGKKCQFQSISKPGKNGKLYSNIIPESVKMME